MDLNFDHGGVGNRSENSEGAVKLSSSLFPDTVFEVSHLRIPLVKFMYFVFTRVPGESYRRRLRSLFL